ncbi:protein spaetzle [Microplitis demolitor]|uniref:protein spaetzle n=1 Tax=Microplitis demolitor TaxID=69319 RepID=UPI00235B7083|nr:protein spaetzle [Microplitis demolitor]
MNFHLIFIIYILLKEIKAFPEKRELYNEETLLTNSNNSRILNQRNLHSSSSRLKDSDKISFPNEDSGTDIIYNYTPVSAPAPSCFNATFCEHVSNYPKDFVKVTLRNRNDLRHLAFVDDYQSTEIDQRIDASDDDTLCQTHETVVFPKTAENKKKEWLFVVNEDDFPQGVRIEKCMTENSSCKLIEGFADGYATTCKQKYIYRQLAAIKPDGAIGSDLFRFPSSCCCHVKFVGLPMQRIGFSRIDNN